jgi:hypothetical protein
MFLTIQGVRYTLGPSYPIRLGETMEFCHIVEGELVRSRVRITAVEGSEVYADCI